MATVLIIDDSLTEIKIIRKILGEEYEILQADCAEQGIKIARENVPDLILMDIIMPGLDGLSACQVLKSQLETAHIPVIFITSISDSSHAVRGFEVGGQDYITKPFHDKELCARVKVHVDLKRSKQQLRQYANELERKNAELKQMLEKIETTAMTDFITGLANRRSMIQRIRAEEGLLHKHTDKMTLILGDIDDFKRVNDTYGHECGDIVLKKLAELMKSEMRRETMISRWGGEEFLLLLPRVDLAEGLVVAERMRHTIEKTVFQYQEQTISITMTFGVAELDRGLGFDSSLKRADEALYTGKGKSKNCVSGYCNGK